MNHAATLEKDGLKANALSPCYVEKYNEVIRRFFSRDKRLWPLFASPEVSMLASSTAGPKTSSASVGCSGISYAAHPR